MLYYSTCCAINAVLFLCRSLQLLSFTAREWVFNDRKNINYITVCYQTVGAHWRCPIVFFY